MENFLKKNRHKNMVTLLNTIFCDKNERTTRPHILTNEPPHGKTNNMHRRKQKVDQLRGNHEAISAFVFATRIVQFLFYLNLKFQASSSFLCLCRPVCAGPVRKPHCWFFHEAVQIVFLIYQEFINFFEDLRH